MTPASSGLAPSGLAPSGRLRPGPSLGLAACAFVTGIVLAGILGGIGLLVTGNERSPAVLIGGFVGLWIPMVGAALLASRAFGSGSPADDLGARFKPADLGWGLLVAIAGFVAATTTQIALSPFPELLGTNTGFVEEQRSSALGVAVVAFSTLVGAPLVEELFFRGLVQRAMVRLGIGAVVVQAILFGVIHVDPAEGMGNVGVILGVGMFGLVQGIGARLWHRLGPVVISHVLFNAAAVLPILLG